MCKFCKKCGRQLVEVTETYKISYNCDNGKKRKFTITNKQCPKVKGWFLDNISHDTILINSKTEDID